jgi:hypothetical protein
LEGKPISSVKELAKKKNIHIRKFRPKEGENWHDVNKRVKKFLDDLLIKYVNPDYKIIDEKPEEEKFKSKNVETEFLKKSKTLLPDTKLVKIKRSETDYLMV